MRWFVFHKKTYLFTILVFAVMFLGLMEVYSASLMWAQFKYQDGAYFIKRQIIFACIGGIGYIIASQIHLNKIEKYHRWIMLITLAAMILVLVPGIGVERNGSRSWFKVASLYVQPSEFLKFAMILTSAHYLSKKKRIISFIKDLFPLLLIVLGGFGLIMLQPDFGSGIVMLCSIIVMVFVAGCPYSYFIKGGIMGIGALAALILSAPYRLERITSFLDPWKDPLGSGFQMIQSLYAIAPGGLLGRGFNTSIQKQFYLPEPQTDFIFSIFAEEFGFIGGAALILMFFLIVYKGVEISIQADSSFEGYVGIGMISLFAIQVGINLGVVVGAFPVTGITLPLFSYGGSSLVVMMTMLGFISGISHSRK